jgi:hypothetical protein
MKQFLAVFLLFFCFIFSAKEKNEKSLTCEEESLIGTYSEICECSSIEAVIINHDRNMQLKSYEEATECTTNVSWERVEDLIKAQQVYVGELIFNYYVKYPTNKIWYHFERSLVENGFGSGYEYNATLSKVLFYKKPDIENTFYSKDMLFMKTYSQNDFKSLKCQKNKDVFLKRMIVSEILGGREKEIVEFLNTLKKDEVNLDAKDVDGVTALHAAVFNGFYKTVELLLKKGANPNIKNLQGKTPIFLAEKRKHEKIVKLLKKYGAKK